VAFASSARTSTGQCCPLGTIRWPTWRPEGIFESPVTHGGSQLHSIGVGIARLTFWQVNVGDAPYTPPCRPTAALVGLAHRSFSCSGARYRKNYELGIGCGTSWLARPTRSADGDWEPLPGDTHLDKNENSNKKGLADYWSRWCSRSDSRRPVLRDTHRLSSLCRVRSCSRCVDGDRVGPPHEAVQHDEPGTVDDRVP
jgi:hypothetical protein